MRAFLLSHPAAQMAIAGLTTAAAIDVAAFRAWKSWHDAATYDWRTASFRWFQGALYGGLTGLGLGGLIGT